MVVDPQEKGQAVCEKDPRGSQTETTCGPEGQAFECLCMCLAVEALHFPYWPRQCVLRSDQLRTTIDGHKLGKGLCSPQTLIKPLNTLPQINHEQPKVGQQFTKDNSDNSLKASRSEGMMSKSISSGNTAHGHSMVREVVKFPLRCL